MESRGKNQSFFQAEMTKISCSDVWICCFSLSYMTEKEESPGFRLLVGQKELFEFSYEALID